MPSQQIPAPNLAHPQEPNHVNWRQGAVMGAFGGISMIAGAAITNLVPASIPTAFTAGASATTWFLTSYATPTIANAALGFGAATVGGVTATVAPPIAVELAVGTTAQYTFNTAYYLWNKNQHQSPLMQKLTQIKGQFKKSNPRNPMTLTLESWEPDYILELGKLLNEKLIGKAKGKPLFKKIEIDAGNMSLPQWESLLSNGLGEFGTQHLAIHNSNQLNQRILISLYEKITQGTFQNLTTLDLSDNHLTPQHLPWLEQIAQKLNLETLILSNNHFNLVEHAHSTENFKSFFSQLHQTMPALKKLEIKNIQLHADSLSYLSPLFTQLSLLSHIAFNQNNIGLNPITELLKNKAHLGNMSLERIVTGQNHHPQVEKLLTIRSNALNALKDKLSNSENTHSAFNIHPLENEVFLFKLLKFIVNEHDSTEKIQEILTSHTQEISLNKKQLNIDLNKTKLVAESLNFFLTNHSNELNLKNFINFKREQPPLEIAAARRAINKLTVPNNENTQPLELSYRLDEKDYVRIKTIHFLEELKEKLTEISKSKREIIIKDIVINHTDLNAQVFSDLLTYGLGNYGTTHLELKNNQLTDDFLEKLADISPDSFTDLKHLDLSDNNFSIKGLKALSLFCKKVNLETLILSDNHFNLAEQAHFTEIFKSFFSQLHQTMPALKKLEIKNIQLDAGSLNYLSPLFTQLSLLSYIDFSQNNLAPNSITKLLRNKAHLGNMSLELIVTGQNHHPQVEKLLTIRSNALNALKDKLSNSENTHPAFNIHPLENEVFLFKLLKFIVNEHDSAEKIQEILTSHTQEISLNKKQLNIDLNKTKLVAESLKFFLTNHSNELNLKNFIDFKREQPPLEIAAARRAINKLTVPNNENTQPLELSYRLDEKDYVRIKTIHFLEELEEKLAELSESNKKIIIKDIVINHTDLNAQVFSNLLSCGLGAYGTTHLELKNNKLTDDFLGKLANISPDSFADLKHLDLSDNNFSIAGLKALSLFCKKMNLESINLSNNPFNPRDLQEKQALAVFFKELLPNNPSLKQLNLDNIGLTDNTFFLLKPLLIQASCLEWLSISQTTLELYNTIEALLADSAFKANLSLKEVISGNDSVLNIKKHLNEKNTILAEFHKNLTEDEQQQPITLLLLNKVLNNQQLKLPQVCDIPLNNLENNTKLTYRQQLVFMANRIKYFINKKSSARQ